MNGRSVIKYLEANGFEILRVKGSHFRMGKNNLRVTVPVHGSRDLGIGLLKAIEKQTRVKLLI